MSDAIPLIPAVKRAMTFQTYPAASPIENVFLLPLRKHREKNGWFLEYLRVESGAAEHIPAQFEIRQLSVSCAAPRRINAFHIHTKRAQNELWTVIRGQLLVWLADCRENSSTASVKNKVVLTAEEPALLHIPAGVAHGYQAGGEGALLLYAMDQQFDPSDPNEGRLPWDYFGRDLWQEDRG